MVSTKFEPRNSTRLGNANATMIVESMATLFALTFFGPRRRVRTSKPDGGVLQALKGLLSCERNCDSS